MAVVVSANEIFEGWIVVSALDTNGVLKSRTKFYELASTVTTDLEARTAMTALLPLLDATNEGDITEWGFRVKFPYDGTTAITVVGNLQREAVLTLRPSTPGDLVTHTIYSPDDTIVSGNNVNQDDADLIAYLNLFESGADFALSDGEQIVATNQIAASRLRTVAGK